jgi:hypothetical protein
MKLTHDQLYKSRGLDECDICWNDEDLIINIKRQYITTEEFNGMINENEQWYYWKLGVNDRNPYEGISLIDCIKS